MLGELGDCQRGGVVVINAEKATVDVGEALQVDGFIGRVGSVQRVEKCGEECGGVGAVTLSVRADRAGELAFCEDAGILREEAEEEAGEEDVEAVGRFVLMEEVGVGGEEFVVHLAHVFGGAAVRVGIRGEVLFLHIRPGEEEGEIAGEFGEGDAEGITGFGVNRGEGFVIRGDDEAGIETERGITGFHFLCGGYEVAAGFGQVDLVFPHDIAIRVRRDVERAGGGGTQAGDAGFGDAVSEEEVEEEIAGEGRTGGEFLDVLLNTLESDGHSRLLSRTGPGAARVLRLGRYAPILEGACDRNIVRQCFRAASGFGRRASRLK